MKPQPLPKTTVFSARRAAWRGLCLAFSLAAASAQCGQAVASPRRCRARRVVARDSATAVLATPTVVRLAVIERPDLFYAYSRYADRNDDKPWHAPAPLAALPTAGAIQRRCATCHGATAPKAGLSLGEPAALSAERRLAAIRRVLADDPRERMPPGEALSREELGQVLRELASPPRSQSEAEELPHDTTD